MADERRDASALRDKLAEVDRALVERLDERARLSKGLADKLGADASIDVGEREWLESLLGASSGDMPKESLRAILGQVRAASRALEQRATVAYVGPEGSFCHEAALEHFGPAAALVPAAGVREALDEVIRGRAAFAVFPFESSVDGLVQPSVTALADTELMMVAERVTRASYDLMARVELHDVEKVYATALGLAACQRFLDAELPLKLRHAIAAARPAMRTGNDVTCLLFSVDDAPGSLFGVLKHFAERGVNLRKLQSRPVPQGSWDYVFYVELSAHVTDRSVTTALEALKRTTKYLKVLGSCPSSGV
jgi:chorismate mutase/prephenate dehydratase